MTSINPRILAINELGQSVWYDNLSRDVLGSGELERLIISGVSGLTSNPTIFKKAIADTADYNNQIRALVEQGCGAERICEDLMLQDVAAAADLLMDTYQRSHGRDGYASVEVSPFLARDAERTFEAAQAIWHKLSRPNIMIKIPGTKESLPAVKKALEAGINVNVTLLFSVDNYERVVEQYLSALEARLARGQKIEAVASVASFFVSRVDAICEKAFDELLKKGDLQAAQRESFFGKVGVANAKLAYASFEKLFRSSRFAALKSRGARVQRPLWASTGTKNPALNPLLYVEELIGPDTVNTVPPATLSVLFEKGKIGAALPGHVRAASAIIAGLAGLNLKFDDLMVKLQEEGVKLFADAYQELLDSIESKVTGLA